MKRTEEAICFWRADFGFQKMVQTLDYNTRPPYLSRYHSNPKVETGPVGCCLLRMCLIVTREFEAQAGVQC